MDAGQLGAAIAALRRLGVDGAVRAADHLGLAAQEHRDMGMRWEERMSYSLREALEEIPLLFGQLRQSEPLIPIARDFVERLTGLVDVPADSIPDVKQIRELMATFESSVDEVDADRRERVARAMMVQARTGQASTQVDAFAKEWAEVVRGANALLHIGVRSAEDAEALLDRGIGLLGALVVPLSDRLEEIDFLAKLADPTGPQVLQLTRLLADERLARYFFTQQGSASWLDPLDRAGLFDPPMTGDWVAGAFLVRAARSEPQLATDIIGRFSEDPHPAAPVVVIEVAEQLGPDSIVHLTQALARTEFANSWGVSRALESLLRSWSEQGFVDSFHRLADLALEPMARPDSLRQVGGKLRESDFKRTVDAFIEHSDCSNISELTRILGYKVRRVAGLTPSGGQLLSLGRGLIGENEYDERDVGDALISGLRDALVKMRECGELLDRRQATLGALDSELVVRIWAGHLADERGDVA